VFLGEAALTEQKTAQPPQVWAVFDITAITYFVLLTVFYHTCAKQSSADSPFPLCCDCARIQQDAGGGDSGGWTTE